MFTLRDYQSEAVQKALVRFHVANNALLVMPTGCGKSAIMLELVRQALSMRPDIRAMILVNRVQLVGQIAKDASTFLAEDQIGVYCAAIEKDLSKRLIVGSVQSLLAVDPEHVNLLVVDEAHQISHDEESGYLSLIRAMQLKNPGMKLLGNTATPFRQDGYIYGEGKLFESVTYTKSLKWMIENGYLVPPRMKHVPDAFDTKGVKITAGEYDLGALEKLVLSDNSKIERQVVDALARLAGRKKVAWACVSIKHAEAVYKLIPEEAALVHSNMTPTERAFHMKSFEEGSAKHMVFVSILNTGYNYPPIDGVVLMRPTRSSNLYVQTCGRGLRTSPGKADCIVLDYGAVVENCGPLDRPYVRTKGTKKKDVPIPMKFCPACFEYVDIAIEACPACGHKFVKPKRDATKNLLDQAADGVILGKKLEWVDVKDVTFAPHVSKAGNKCFKVTYHTTNLFRPEIREYVMANAAPYHMVIGMELLTTLEPALVTNKIKRVLLEWDGMFPRVKDVERENDTRKNAESPGAEEGLLSFVGERGPGERLRHSGTGGDNDASQKV